MARNVHCLRKDHEDYKASALLNDSPSDRFPVGVVHCFGCGTWYYEDDPDSAFYSYQDLTNYRREFGPISYAKSSAYKDSEGTEVTVLKFPTLRASYYEGPHSGHKSRLNLYGQTLKCYVKDDTHFVKPDGSVVYVNKVPRPGNDYEGTHETVKEFLWTEDADSINVHKGFLNRFAVDSDDTSTPLEQRLVKVCETAGVKGFWLILNRSNYKFQCSINFTHTVCGGVDMAKARYVAKCVNDIAGDDKMTNSLMKNHKVYNPNEDPFAKLKGAEPTDTYGFDYDLYKDYKYFVETGSDPQSDCAWNSFWRRKIDSGELDVVFIDNRDESSPGVIPLIAPPKDPEFNVRKDKTWAMPLEYFWKATALKYPRVKYSDGKAAFDEDYEYSSVFVRRQQAYNVCSSVLKDVEDEAELEEYKYYMYKYLNVNPEKYCDYYKPSMHKENKSFVRLSNHTSESLTGYSMVKYDLFELLKDEKAQALVVAAVRSSLKDGKVSVLKKDGLYSGWDSVVAKVATKDEQLASSLSSLSKGEVEVLRGLFKVLESNSYFFGLSLFDSKRFKDLPSALKPVVSLATELVYNDALDFCSVVSANLEYDVLDFVKQRDFVFYSSVMVQYVAGSILRAEEVDFGSVVEDRVTAVVLNECNEKAKDLLGKATGFTKRAEFLLECIEKVKSLKEEKYVEYIEDPESSEVKDQLFNQDESVEFSKNSVVLNEHSLKYLEDEQSESRYSKMGGVLDNLNRSALDFRRKLPPSLLVFVDLIIKELIKIYLSRRIFGLKRRRRERRISSILLNNEVFQIILNLICNRYCNINVDLNRFRILRHFREGRIYRSIISLRGRTILFLRCNFSILMRSSLISSYDDRDEFLLGLGSSDGFDIYDILEREGMEVHQYFESNILRRRDGLRDSETIETSKRSSNEFFNFFRLDE